MAANRRQMESPRGASRPGASSSATYVAFVRHTSIQTLAAITDEDAETLAVLLTQLSSTATFDRDRIQTMIDHDATDLFVARSDTKMVGMATLVTVPLPSGLRGHVEDVVVDSSMRGRGVARLLLEAIVRSSEEQGLRTLDLTSRPSRESALRLYESLGFRRRDTTVLRHIPAR